MNKFWQSARLFYSFLALLWQRVINHVAAKRAVSKPVLVMVNFCVKTGLLASLKGL